MLTAANRFRRFRSIHGKTSTFDLPTPSSSLSLSRSSALCTLIRNKFFVYAVKWKNEQLENVEFNPQTHDHLFRHVSFKKCAIIRLMTNVFNKTTRLFVRVRIPNCKGNRNLTSNFICSFANKISPTIFIRWKKKMKLDTLAISIKQLRFRILFVSDTGSREDVDEAVGAVFRYQSIVHWYPEFDRSDRSGHWFRTFNIFYSLSLSLSLSSLCFVSLLKQRT